MDMCFEGNEDPVVSRRKVSSDRSIGLFYWPLINWETLNKKITIKPTRATINEIVRLNQGIGDYARGNFRKKKRTRHFWRICKTLGSVLLRLDILKSLFGQRFIKKPLKKR